MKMSALGKRRHRPKCVIQRIAIFIRTSASYNFQKISISIRRYLRNFQKFAQFLSQVPLATMTPQKGNTYKSYKIINSISRKYILKTSLMRGGSSTIIYIKKLNPSHSARGEGEKILFENKKSKKNPRPRKTRGKDDNVNYKRKGKKKLLRQM